MSTNSVASVVELEVIKQQMNKTTGLSKTTKIKSYLSQFKSFLKVLDISYQDSNTSLPITPTQIAVALFSSSLFKSVILEFLPHIMKISFSSDMLVIWIDIWDFQRGSKDRTLIDHLFNFE